MTSETSRDDFERLEVTRAFLEELKLMGSVWSHKVLDDGTCEILPMPVLAPIKIKGVTPNDAGK